MQKKLRALVIMLTTVLEQKEKHQNRYSYQAQYTIIQCFWKEREKELRNAEQTIHARD